MAKKNVTKNKGQTVHLTSDVGQDGQSHEVT